MSRRVPLLLAALLMLSGCAPAAETPEPSASVTAAAAEETVPPSPEVTPADPVQALLEELTVEEKAGQLLVVGMEGLTPGEDARWALQEAKVGGMVLFGRNVERAEQLVELTNSLKARNGGRVPLLLCVDEEGGAVSRMPWEVEDLPSAYDFAQRGGDFRARGEALAGACKAFGFNVNLAPVLDIWSNPNNTVIGKRACGRDPETVARLGRDLIDGLSAGGVMPVAKHFPGHGDTAADSHVDLPVVDKSLEELGVFELYPYESAFENGLAAVMVGHILLPQLDPERPASLSPQVVTGLLREEMGFDGLVFTDDLTMGAVTKGYGVGQAAVLAVEAGCDVVLVCHGAEEAREAYAALLEAVDSGRISRERLDESVRRVLSVKLDPACAMTDEPIDFPNLEALNQTIRESLRPNN